LERQCVSEKVGEIIDWVAFQTARSELGGDFIRILGYFREDGTKSVEALETAVRANNAVAMVMPAHTLKGDARQFGADALGDLAEIIEDHARQCIEWGHNPDDAIEHVVKLRPLFAETMEAFHKETNPLVERRSFGKRDPIANNQGFGRI
jgi:HPt (histidine-containing phosphotransfer) domain-containing protein